MSDDEPPTRAAIPDGNRTMQIDALTDVELSDLLPPQEPEEGEDDREDTREDAREAGAIARPPPLPSRRRSARPWLALALVVIAMSALGAVVGHFVLGGPGTTAEAAPRAPRQVEIGEIVIGAPPAAGEEAAGEEPSTDEAAPR